MQTLHFITGNKGKAKEAELILGFPLEIVNLDIVEIQGSYEEIIRHKVRSAFEILQRPLFVDDVSVEISAWNGFPGPYMKYIEKVCGYDVLLKMLKNEKDRRILARASIGYHDGKDIHIFSGEVKGTIAEALRGTNGWGFDVIFIPEGHTQTFAEMGPEEKSKISHRRRALEKFREYLNSKE